MPDPKPSTPLPPQPESIPLHMDFRAVWQRGPSPEEFLFPYVEASVTIYDGTTGEAQTGKLRTIGAHDPADIFSNIYAKLVNPNMRGAIERPLFIALMLIKDSEDYKQAHDEWRRWKQTQPSNYHDKLIKQAKGILTTTKAS